MSSFDPQRYQLSPAEWQEKASEAIDTNCQVLVIGGIIGGIFAASATAFPPTGLLVAGWAFYEAWKRTNETNRNEQAITDYGCVAHVLKGDDFRAFKSQVGNDETMRQIRWAHENGYALSNDALDFLETQTPLLKPANVTQPANDTNPIAHNSNDISQTRTDIYQPQALTDFDIVERIAADLTNQLIVGIPGAGKGILISNSLDAVRRLHPKVTIFYLDPKGDEKETGYFEGRVHILKRAKARTMPPTDVVKWFRSCIAEFEAIDGAKLLVFDEATNVSGKFKAVGGSELKWFQDLLRGFISSGDSEGLRTWIVCQNPHTEALGFDGGLRSQFTPIAIVSTKNIAAYGALLSTKFIPQNQKLDTDSIESLCAASPVKRCMYHGGENCWYPMRKLPNFSGYDRDAREFISLQNSESYPTDKQVWDRWVLEASDDQINELIEAKRNKAKADDTDVNDTHSHTDSEPRTPLTEAEQKLIDFAAEKPNEWLSPSWFTNNKEYFKTWKSEQVIELFHRLKDKGYGDTIFSNGTRKFRLPTSES